MQRRCIASAMWCLLLICTLTRLSAQSSEGKRRSDASHLANHPLIHLQEAIEQKRVLLSYRGKEYVFGSHFHGFGKGLVKGANLTFRTVSINGEERIECEFKLNHVFRARLERFLKNFSVNGGDSPLRSSPSDDALNVVHKLIAPGIGEMVVGASLDFPNLYDQVIVRIAGDATLYDLHELLALANLDTALLPSTQEDLDRLKMGHLFRCFHPKEATHFERCEEFFTLPIDNLANKIIELAPDMQQIFDEYLHQMEAEEIFPGRIRYRMPHFAEQVFAAGGRHLIAAIMGTHGEEELFDRIGSILSLGLLCTEFRDAYQVDTIGLGSGVDYLTGGADSVYTQMLTETHLQNDQYMRTLAYQGTGRILISLDALEMGTYQYFTGASGLRRYELSQDKFKTLYIERPTIIELTQGLQESIPGKKGRWHEIMLKERLDPKYIQGILVSDRETRERLLDYLRSCRLVQQDCFGHETILGVPADQFLRF